MTKTVKIGNINIGEGMPKICVPVTAEKYKDIVNEIQMINEEFKNDADIIEFRIDYYEDVNDIEKVKSLLQDVRNAAGDMPILLTFRTKTEGGEKEISADDYEKLLIEVAKTKLVDAIDVEIKKDINVFKEVLEQAHKNNVKVVASNHNFIKTPETDEMISTLEEMAMAGADIAKIAVMPVNKKDVINLLQASIEADEKLNVPIITISMGKLGAISRMSGQFTGSAVTFGVAKKSSAPGQIGAAELKSTLNTLYK